MKSQEKFYGLIQHDFCKIFKLVEGFEKDMIIKEREWSESSELWKKTTKERKKKKSCFVFEL